MFVLYAEKLNDMERTKTNTKPTAILTSDWHLREDAPPCRLDDFWKTQWEKVMFVSALQEKYGCPVIHAGDLFHHWKPSPYLLATTIHYLPKEFYTVYGQHDLPQHNFELRHKSGIHVLQEAGALKVLKGTSWGQEPIDVSIEFNIVHRVLVWHKMNYQGKLPWPDCPDPMAASLLRKYKDFDIIVTGDNHKPFVEEYQGRFLVNPGSLMRQEAGQIDHQPRVYLWYAETNNVTAVNIPVDKSMVTREHIEVKEERDKRIEAFISHLNDDWEANLSFEDNLKLFASKNNVRESVMEIIYKAIEL
jgi:DNA repair exonuclease SbcCD nuclease subunit